MQLHQDFSYLHYTIRAYGLGQVTVQVPQQAHGVQSRPALQTEVLTRSVVIMPQRLIRDWPPQRTEDLTLAHFQAIAALEPEIVLLGSGKGLKFPSAELLMPFHESGIGVEVVDTGAACRTYNILVTEGRIVAAALLMIEPE